MNSHEGTRPTPESAKNIEIGSYLKEVLKDLPTLEEKATRQFLEEAVRMCRPLWKDSALKEEESRKHIERRVQFLAILQEQGVLQHFIGNDLLDDRDYNTSTSTEAIEKLIGEALGQDFLKKIVKDLHEFKRKHGEETSTHGAAGLFHLSTEKATMEILKNGFKPSDRHQSSNIGTSDFEKKMGLNGVFVTRGTLYQDADGSDSLEGSPVFVFPDQYIHAPGTIATISELSPGVVEGVVSNYAVSESTLDRRAQLRRTALAATLHMFESIVPPETIDPVGDRNLHEICLNTESLGAPSMLFVDEDPGYFYDQMAAHQPDWTESTAIIEEAQARKAVQQALQNEEELSRFSDVLEQFMRLQQQGEINIDHWKHQSDSTN